ncbi:MAG: RagB/SusD family nutrient uptake outer membrane protein [Prevotella sp.]|nr:RagB/SusD family nutrient uptake outer membrane protein [Prevotella sp.]
MKKYLSIAILSVSMLGITSCDMDAPSKSSLEPEIIYNTYEIALNNVMAINDCFGETNSYRARFIPYYGLNTDAEWLNSPTLSGKSSGKYNATQYDTDAGNDQLNVTKGPYDSFYQGIEKANIAIANMEKYSDLTNEKFQQLYGEALTLRAVLYMDLIKAYGDVPARFSETTNENSYLPRTPQDVILKQLLKDLEKAAEFCAWPGTDLSPNVERVSKTFAKALRARCALWAAGYALHDDKGVGVYRQSTDPELAPNKMYLIAKQECEDIINSGKSTWTDDFEGIWRKVCEEDLSAGSESIWEIPFVQSRGRVVSSLGVRHDVAKDQYIDWATDKNVGGVVGPVPTLYYDFDKNDVRRDVSITLYKWNISDENLKKGVYIAQQEPYQLKSMCLGKLRYEWMKRKATAQDDGVNFVYMRLADVYLMAAEACNELGDPITAKRYLDKVVNRAFQNNIPANYYNRYGDITTQEDFRKAVREQRKFEFVGEAIRKHDLIRWGVIDDSLAVAKQKLNDLAARTGEYSNLISDIWYNVKSDNTIEIYGNERGDTEEEGDYRRKELGWTKKGWFENSDGVKNLTDDIINGLYVVDKPSLHCLWPIPTIVVSKSNGLLNNNFLGK